MGCMFSPACTIPPLHTLGGFIHPGRKWRSWVETRLFVLLLFVLRLFVFSRLVFCFFVPIAHGIICFQHHMKLGWDGSLKYPWKSRPMVIMGSFQHYCSLLYWGFCANGIRNSPPLEMVLLIDTQLQWNCSLYTWKFHLDLRDVFPGRNRHFLPIVRAICLSSLALYLFELEVNKRIKHFERKGQFRP